MQENSDVTRRRAELLGDFLVPNLLHARQAEHLGLLGGQLGQALPKPSGQVAVLRRLFGASVRAGDAREVGQVRGGFGTTHPLAEHVQSPTRCQPPQQPRPVAGLVYPMGLDRADEDFLQAIRGIGMVSEQPIGGPSAPADCTAARSATSHPSGDPFAASIAADTIVVVGHRGRVTRDGWKTAKTVFLGLRSAEKRPTWAEDRRITECACRRSRLPRPAGPSAGACDARSAGRTCGRRPRSGSTDARRRAS